MALARLRLVVGVVGHGEHAGTPRKGVAAPEAGRRVALERRANSIQDLAHEVLGKTLGHARAFDGLENVRLILRLGGFHGGVLRGNSQEKHNRRFRGLGHVLRVLKARC